MIDRVGRAFNWNLTPIKRLGIFVALHYAPFPFKLFEPWRVKARACLVPLLLSAD
jgi:hypothetical protein